MKKKEKGISALHKQKRKQKKIGMNAKPAS